MNYANAHDQTLLLQLRRHARIWKRFAIMALAREAQFRANAVTTALVGLARIAVSVIPLFALFSFVDEVNGWSRAEVLALTGLFQVVTSLFHTFVAGSMARFSDLVREGHLDSVLLRPISSQFYVTFRWIDPSSVFPVIAGLPLLLFGLMQSNHAIGFGAAIGAVLVALCGTIMLGCVCSAMVYLVFWSTSVNSIWMLFFDFLEAGAYPAHFFPTGLRAVLFTVFPIAFATTVPLDVLFERSGLETVAIATIATCIAVLCLRRWWGFALRSYSSASS